MRLHASRKIVAARKRAARFVLVRGRTVHPIHFALAERLHSCFAGKEQQDENDKNNRKDMDVKPHGFRTCVRRRPWRMQCTASMTTRRPDIEVHRLGTREPFVLRSVYNLPAI